MAKVPCDPILRLKTKKYNARLVASVRHGYQMDIDKHKLAEMYSVPVGTISFWITRWKQEEYFATKTVCPS
jgi:hypothetical protein